MIWMNIYCIFFKDSFVDLVYVLVFYMGSNHSSIWFSTILLAKVGASFLLQVNSVFVEGFLPTWNDEQVNECFGKFGVIERVVLASNMQYCKRKYFGFLNYTTRESPLACIEEFNKDDELIDGDIKVCFS